MAGKVEIDWGEDGPNRDKAERVLLAIMLGARTEGDQGWDSFPDRPEPGGAGRPDGRRERPLPIR